MVASFAASDIPRFIDQLKNCGDRKAWVHRGLLLEQIRKQFVPWPARGELTFGKVVEQFAQGVGLSNVMLWREMKVVNYYAQLRTRLERGGYRSPLIDEIADQVSVGHLDLLERISLVLDEAGFLQLADRTINPRTESERISRAQLERQWDALKVSIPELPRGRQRKDFSVAEASRVEGRIVAALLECDGAWTDQEDLHGYEVFPGDRDLTISLPVNQYKKTNYTPDAVVVTLVKKGRNPVFHGIEVKNLRRKGGGGKIQPDFAAAASSFDYFWLAMPKEDLLEAARLPADWAGGTDEYCSRLGISRDIGVLALDADGRIEVMHPAASWEESHRNSGESEHMIHASQVLKVSKRLLARRLIARRPKRQ